MFSLLPAPFDSALAFILVLGVLVFIHELGHYLAARWRGVHVEVFSIGFGRALASWMDRRGTTWKLAWIPLGGYVKLHGQEQPEDVSDEVRASWIPGRTFHEKSVGSRAIVVAAGPLANFALAAVLFAALYTSVGVPTVPPVIGIVDPGSAAEKAGLQVGDRIEAIGTEPTARFLDVQRRVTASPGQTLILHVRRGSEALTIPAVPEMRDIGGGRQAGRLGIRGGATEYEQVGIGSAMVAGVTQTWSVTVQTLDGIWQMLSGQRGAEDLGGPLRIAQMSGQVAQLGFASLVSFIAVLSVNLALINLFPVPILDGGHLLFFLAEAIRGRPLPPRAQEYGVRAGLALLVALFVFATWNDLGQIGLFRWVASLGG